MAKQNSDIGSAIDLNSESIRKAIQSKADSDTRNLRLQKKEAEEILKNQESQNKALQKTCKLMEDINKLQRLQNERQKEGKELSEKDSKKLEDKKAQLDKLKETQSEYIKAKEKELELENAIEDTRKASIKESEKRLKLAKDTADAEMSRLKTARLTASERTKQFQQESRQLEEEAEYAKKLSDQLKDIPEQQEEYNKQLQKSKKLTDDAKTAREKYIRALQSSETMKLKGMTASERQEYQINKVDEYNRAIDEKNAEIETLNETIEGNNAKIAELQKEYDQIKADIDINEEKREAKLADLERQIEGIREDNEDHEQRLVSVNGEKDSLVTSFVETGGKLKGGSDKKGILDIAQLFGGESGSGVKGAWESIKGAGKKNMNGATGMIGGFVSGSSEVLKKGIGAALSVAPGWVGTLIKIVTGIAQGLVNIGKVVEDGIKASMQLQTDYMGRINTRLQGLTSDFDNAYQDGGYYDVILKNLDGYADNAFLDKSKMIKNISDLVGQGVAYNVEERALIMTIGDKLVTTFEANNEELLRLIRLQQQDLTVAQLGAEAQLTQFFNETYSDTSYLTKEYDTVFGAISEAMALMNSEDAVNFNYNVQKWLGSMYSVGASQDAINKLAQGINALATGDVDYFNGNSAATVLFAGASGGSFGNLLNEGVNADTIDSLMQNIIGYLSQIADDTTLVTKQKRAGVYGDLNLSDVRAILGLSKDIDKITNGEYHTINGISGGETEADRQLSMLTVGKRISQGEIIDNIINNFKLNFGNELLRNDNGLLDSYTTYRIVDAFGGKTLKAVYEGILGMKAVDKFFEDEEISTPTPAEGDYYSWAMDIPVEQDQSVDLGSNFDRAMSRKIKGSYWDQITSALRGLPVGYTFASKAAMRGATNDRGTNPFVFYDGSISSSGISSSSFVDMGGIATNIGGASSSMIYSGNNSSVGVNSVGGNISTFNTLSNNLSEYGGVTSTSSSSIVSTAELREASDIYHRLFEDQSTPIRVKLASLESEAIKNLNAELIVSIYEKLISGVEVTDTNNDVSRNVVNALANIRYIER